MEELLEQPVRLIAQAIREKQLTAKQVTTAFLDRLESVNPAINAVVLLNAEAAMKSAERADLALAGGETPGKLFGVPMTIKDSLDTFDTTTTWGTLGRQSFRPGHDATCVERLRNEGAILIGKTNTPEFTLSFKTDNLLFGKTNNPYDPSRTSGGSSGGAAAAIAARATPFDVGTDTGGSIRLPSHFCGITGIKPTTGRVPCTGNALPSSGLLAPLSQPGPMAKCVDDLIYLLEIMQGPDYLDPHAVPVPWQDPHSINLGDLKIGYHTDNGISTPDDAVIAAVSSAIDLLQSEGMTTDEVRPSGLEMSGFIYSRLFAADNGEMVDALLEDCRTDHPSPPVAEIVSSRKDSGLNASEFAQTISLWHNYQSSMLSYFNDHDVLVCPVNARTAIKHDKTEDFADYTYTAAYNLTGWPSAVIRAGTDPEGLPVGIQIIARPFAEHHVLSAASWLEEKLGTFPTPGSIDHCRKGSLSEASGGIKPNLLNMRLMQYNVASIYRVMSTLHRLSLAPVLPDRLCYAPNAHTSFLVWKYTMNSACINAQGTSQSRRGLVAGLILSITCSGVSAATLEEIYNLAVINDPQLGAAEAVFLSQNEVVAQSRALILPNIAVRGSSSDNRRTLPTNPPSPAARFNDHGWQAVINQPIFRLDSWYLFRLAKDVQAEAVANFAAEQQALLVRVSESYFAILEAEAALSASNAERNAVQRQLEQVQQRFDVGLVAITDVLESQAAYDSSTVTVIESEGLQSTSFEPLLRLTGSYLTDVNGLTEEFPVKYPEPQNEDAWVETALENNYSLVAAKERLKSAEKGLKLAKSGHYPTVDAQVSYSHSVAGSINLIANKVNQRSMVVNVNMPIYQGGGVRSGVRQAGYNLEAAQQNLDLIQRQVVENTRILYTAINTDVARVRARLRGIESSQSALDATQTGYEVGTRNIVDVLNAQRTLYLSQFQYASARYQYVLDTLRLKQVVGTLNPQDIYDLNQFIDTSMVISRNTPSTR